MFYVVSNSTAGTNTGDITIWEVGTRQRLVSRNFNVWDIKACSTALQVWQISTLHTEKNFKVGKYALEYFMRVLISVSLDDRLCWPMIILLL